MRYASIGKPRRVTDEQVRRVREWKPLADLARELGITFKTAKLIREGYHFKQRSP